ncbi:Uroporphyrinogen-III synthase [Gigaspora margarita]|uniref:Uroporphyrinogen-III synthase n=1 Tax=Gigaspora margarita TaxID=4874 RepID=A0A8H4B1V7_GIGMA|nr:Uroporphyrinogen-III synthase [Gigaspora margarita]
MSKGTVLLLKDKASIEQDKTEQSTTYDISDSTQIPDEYETKLASLSYTSIFLPVLSYVFVNIEELTKILKNGPEKKYWGIVVTSQKAVKGLKLAWNNAFNNVTEDSLNKEKALWENLPFFVVGKATSKATDGLNFNALGLNSGNSESLAEYIIQFHNQNNTQNFHQNSLPLLFLTGDKRLDKLPTRLSQAGIKLEELLVYETRPDENFSTELENIVKKNRKIDWIVFFSPSGVDVAWKSLTKLNLWKTVKIACIGKTTGNYLEKCDIKVHVISPKPEPESLACSINEYVTRNNNK